MEWQPIETAPQDGTPIIGAWQYLNKTWDMNVVLCHKEDGEVSWWDYYADHTHDPTHWMPLPEPPK